MAAKWSNSEIRALLPAWSDSKIQEELDGAKRTNPVYEKIASHLQDVDSTKNWKQCKDKIKNVQSEFKKTKDHNNKTGKKMKMKERSSSILTN